MFGVLVNSFAVIIGGIAGVLLKMGISDRYKTIIMDGIALCVAAIGLNLALKAENMLIVILSIVIGSIIGEWADLEGKLNKIGEFMQQKTKKLSKNDNSKFAEGYVNSSLLFCVGAMAIVGSIQSGLRGDNSILYAKSVLDGITSIVFGSTFGIGVVFSSLSILLYQGLIAETAFLMKNILNGSTINAMNAVGGLLIVGISLNMLSIKRIKVGNMIPSVFIPIIYSIVTYLK